MTTHPRRRQWAGWLVGLWLSPWLAAAPSVVYGTDFEEPVFRAGFTLNGQDAWVASPASADISSLVDTNWFESSDQQAVIGYLPPESPGAGSASAYRPLDFDPVARGTPLVVFSVSLALFDPGEADADAFRWVVYNRDNGGQRLFALDFDVWTTEISFLLDDDPEPYPTDSWFDFGGIYDLVVTMNFASNVWSATLNDRLVVNAAPMTLEGRTLDLGDIDAAWVAPEPGAFGDSFMVFDAFRVVADVAAPLPCRVEPVQFLQDGSLLLRLFGEPGRTYAVDGSSDFLNWTALSTNTPGNGSFPVLDSEAAGRPQGFYRGRAVWP